MSRSQTVLALTVCCAFTFGLVVVLLSSMRSHLAKHLHVAENRVDSLWAAMNFVLVPLTLVSGMIIDLGDIRAIIIAGSVFLAISLLLLRTDGGFKRALLAYLFTAAGGACVSVAAIVLMPQAFFGPGEASASLNMGNVFFALGALIAPALADVLLRGMGLRHSLFVLSLIVLAPGAIALLVPADALPATGETDLIGLMTEPVVLWAAAVFFLYAPIEGCVHTWASSFLRDVGGNETETSHLIAAFWSSFLLGRLFMAYLQHLRVLADNSERWIVCLLALFATIMIGNLMGTQKGKVRSAVWGLLLLGFFLGPIFPTLVGLLFAIYPSGQGTVFGTLFAMGSAGSLFVGPMMTSRVSRSTAQKSLAIPLILGLLLMVVSLIFALWEINH
jgi:fucose permease